MSEPWVWVVQDVDFGWDNVVGLYSSDIPEEDILREYPQDTYILSVKHIETKPERE